MSGRNALLLLINFPSEIDAMIVQASFSKQHGDLFVVFSVDEAVIRQRMFAVIFLLSEVSRCSFRLYLSMLLPAYKRNLACPEHIPVAH